jgi:hypothetical protein
MDKINQPKTWFKKRREEIFVVSAADKNLSA